MGCVDRNGHGFKMGFVAAVVVATVVVFVAMVRGDLSCAVLGWIVWETSAREGMRKIENCCVKV